MIKEFIEFVSELFPSISPYTKENVKKAIEQFNVDNLEWFMPTQMDELSQGDIIELLPFSFFNDEGQRETLLSKGIVLSNSCDIDHDDNIIIAPLILTKEVLKTQDSINNLKMNKHYDKMCFTNSQLDEYFVDFTRSTSFNRKIVEKLLNEKTTVQYSLNQYGYYLLLTKLTVYLLRPEDSETNAIRAC